MGLTAGLATVGRAIADAVLMRGRPWRGPYYLKFLPLRTLHCFSVAFSSVSRAGVEYQLRCVFVRSCAPRFNLFMYRLILQDPLATTKFAESSSWSISDHPPGSQLLYLTRSHLDLLAFDQVSYYHAGLQPDPVNITLPSTFSRLPPGGPEAEDATETEPLLKPVGRVSRYVSFFSRMTNLCSFK